MKITRTSGMLAIAAVGLVGLAGCGVAEAGEAITYRGGQISEQQVADQAQELADQFDIAVTARITGQTIQRLANYVLVDEGSAQLGIEATGAEVDQLLVEAEQQAGSVEELEQQLGDRFIPASQIPVAAESQVKLQKMAEQLAPGAEPVEAQEALGEFLVAVGEDIDLQVNPRFGQWNPTALQVEPPSDALSRPADNSFSIEELLLGSG